MTVDLVPAISFERLAPQIPRRVEPPTLPDHDGGDEHSDRCGWVVFLTSPVRFEGVMIVCNPSLYDFTPPAPDHDPGDEDDAYNYVPSRDPATGLRCWIHR